VSWLAKLLFPFKRSVSDEAVDKTTERNIQAGERFEQMTNQERMHAESTWQKERFWEMQEKRHRR
jgi:hypothetical protein